MKKFEKNFYNSLMLNKMSASNSKRIKIPGKQRFKSTPKSHKMTVNHVLLFLLV